MTTSAPIEETAGIGEDPHASKVTAGDPRLTVARAKSRTLRRGPAIGIAVALSAVVMLGLLVALQPSDKKAAKDAEPLPAPAQASVLPDSIRNLPDKPEVIGPPVRAGASQDAGLELGLVPSLAEESPDSHHAGQRPTSSDPNSPEKRRQERIEQMWRARNAGILFEGAGAPSLPSSKSGSSSERGLSGASVPLPSSLGSNGTSSSKDPDTDPNLQERKNAFLDGVGAAKTQDYVQSRVQHPRSPYEVKAGTVIPAVLITAVNSDLPGPVIGQVRENVYDTVSGNYLLIPQGARLLASYDSMVVWGQERVLVCWNRLVFPNGDSMNLECMPAADLQGAAGLTDEVDEHWGRILKGVAVASLLSATAQGVAGNTTGYSPTVPQTWARNTAGEINQVGQQITRRNINIQPTLTVRPGFSVNVIVHKDMILSPYR